MLLTKHTCSCGTQMHVHKWAWLCPVCDAEEKIAPRPHTFPTPLLQDLFPERFEHARTWSES